MKIKKIVIKNYRSFGDSEESIDIPDINIPISIVGYNNCGKTNFLNAIKYTCGLKENYEKYNDCDFYCNNTKNDITIDVYFSESIEVKSIYGKDKNKSCSGARLEIKCRDNEIIGWNYALDSKGEIIRNQEQLKGQSLPVLFSRYKQYLNLYYIDFKNIEKHLKITANSILGEIIGNIKKDFKLDNNVVKNKEGNNISRNEYYKKLLDFIESNLLRTELLDNFLVKVEAGIKEQMYIDKDRMKFSFQLPTSDEIYDSMRFKLSDNEKKPAIPIERLGDGFKSMLIIAILRVLLELEEGGKIIILEEPETFLHEHFQEYFYQILSKLAERNQIIYSTHSKKFINIFEPESIIRIKNDDYLNSSIVYNSKPQIDYPDVIDNFTVSQPEDFSKYMRTLEPNLGNIIFANKVIIVEGPNDLLAYKTILSKEVNFGINNIAIICAWGKDPITTLIQLCKRYGIPYFVIHDWDLPDDTNPNTKPQPIDDELKKVLSSQKAQWTKNQKIIKEAQIINIHHNKSNLEEVLDIPFAQKGDISVFEKINNKDLKQIIRDYPKLISSNLLKFLQLSND